MKPIQYKDKTFTSYQQAADFIGITKTGFAKRYRKYEAGEYDLNDLFYDGNYHLTHLIYYKNQKFSSHAEAAKFIGITSVSFNRRYKKYLRSEISLKNLFKKPKYTIYPMPDWHGKIFNSKKEAASYVGISQNTFTQRLRRYYNGDYTLDDIFASDPLELQKKHSKTMAITYNGHTFETQREACQYLGISQSAFSARYHKYLSGELPIDELFRRQKH
ncbi:MAG: hypothetical protein DUD35_14405 [Lactobacillus sp.]|uniref:NUMOD1 domain-containing DNA-binding protein n=1 Tax=Lentilactobacillus hilgardii TaxID=1588 RepID=UPI000FEE3BF9|nr:NUMOD1 domain-containing DNA-binding protein [Lentilactobacillus hilgardii]MCT3390820.1 hypothetical protein [Lentilactobacillus hilgardii]RRG06542.1 MAG: hypothetical protein DUD35_14405 [Lactobacillus sp.]